MIQLFRKVILLVTLLSAGCVQTQPLLIDEPIGPSHHSATRSGHGALVVYSETRPFSGDPDYLIHTGYTLLTPQGALIQLVDNHSGIQRREPTEVTLPVGRYSVLARDARYGTIRLIAIIEPGRTTVIDLNGELLSEPDKESDRWVRLPTGRIIGLRSE